MKGLRARPMVLRTSRQEKYILLSLTTDTENNTERHTNVGTVGRSMTHRKFLSLVHIHDQDS